MDYIDGLRGLACLMVILCHIDYLYPFKISFGIARFNSNPLLIGFVGVNLFLVLSGFCLYWPLVRPGREQRQLGLADYAKRRARRILPPYYAACVLAALLAWNTPGILTALGIHAVLLQTNVPGYTDNLLGQTWSIVLEAQCYLLFPLFVQAFKRGNPRLVLLLLAAGNALYRWAVVHYAGPDFNLVNNVFGRAFDFAVGMFAAQCVANWNETERTPLGPLEFLALVAAIPTVCLAVLAPHDVDRLAPGFDLSWAMAFFALIVAGSRSFVRRALSVPKLVWMGEISYSVYLCHAHVLMFTAGVVHFGYWRGPLPAVGALIIVVLCFAVGYGFFRVFEKPFLSRASPPLLV